MDTEVKLAITAAEALQRLGGWGVAVVAIVIGALLWRSERAEKIEMRISFTKDITELSRNNTTAMIAFREALVAHFTKLDYLERERRT